MDSEGFVVRMGRLTTLVRMAAHILLPVVT